MYLQIFCKIIECELGAQHMPFYMQLLDHINCNVIEHESFLGQFSLCTVPDMPILGL